MVNTAKEHLLPTKVYLRQNKIKKYFIKHVKKSNDRFIKSDYVCKTFFEIYPSDNISKTFFEI